MDFSNVAQRRKMVLLGGLYITQFLGLGFIITAVPAIMRENGASLDEIGVIYVLGLVWAIKFLWAPLVDRYGSKKHGHYRSWLIVLQSLIIISLVGAAFFDIGTQLNTLAVFFAFISIFSATQDIAADALGVTILKPEERGIGNSIQMGGGFIGNLIGGGIVLIAYEWIGWTASLLILAAATSIPLLNIWRHKEKPAPADVRDEKVGYRDMIRFFRRPRIGSWVAVLLTYSLGISIVYALLNPMLVDIGWSLDQIGLATNIVGSLVSILGAAVAGLVVQRIGRKLAMLIANVMVGLSIFVLFPTAQGVNNGALIYGSICLMLFAYGANSTILATMMMDKSNPETAGTDYTLQYSLFSIFSFVFSGGALALAEVINYSGVLWISIGITAVSLILVWLYKDFEPVAFAGIAYELPLGDDAPIATGD
ncbi:MAG: MFS transporter [Chloroflexota bacterium]